MDNSEIIKEFWLKFLESDPHTIKAQVTYQTWAFGRTPADADELVSLVLAGVKTATASLVWSYEAENEPLPLIGDYSLVLGGSGEPVCIIQTTSVEVRPFIEVDDRQAREEGEGDLSLSYWREVHWRFFSEECTDLGRSPDERMPVCCERFRLCYPLSGNDGNF